tara:strand:+ start:39049 stop:44217 length:5169 start_codon:yes stop_codon:yes gene_type:complete
MDNINKLNYYEPNACNNEIIPNEDISIYVSLDTITKGRTILMVDNIEGEHIVNTGGKSTTIKFLDETENGDNALTTSYTEVTSLLADDEQIETLGIESIDIDFDTAYTPLIKIRFVDLRGTSILGKGNESKYRMFFDLPYPIFSLTVKGYYGKPVKYCLHLLKWNAKFNSKTGNFEIDAEFIGYTYAILTDLLLGYMRAVVYTDEGSKVFRKYKEEYKNATPSIELKTIDEFLDDVTRLNDEIEGIKNDDPDFESLGIIEDTRTFVIDTIENKLKGLEAILKPSLGNYFKNNGVLVTPTKINDTKIGKSIDSYRSEIEKIIDDANGRLEQLGVQLSPEKIIEFKLISNVDGKQYTGRENLVVMDELYKSSEYDKTDGDVTEDVEWLANELIGNLKPDEVGQIDIYDFRDTLTELDRVEKALNKTQKELQKKLGKKIRDEAKIELNFDPTIRNIFRIFTTHCEILLETIKNVSISAEDNKVREKIIKDLISHDEELNQVDLSKSIYPWPEYRKKETKNADSKYTETWLGTEPMGYNDKQKIDEIKFVEDMLAQLMVIATKDEDAVLNYNKDGNQYYPISPLDTKVFNGRNINPYFTAVFNQKNTGVKNQAIRCLLMRGFLGLGVSNRNYPNKLILAMGAFEAENLFEMIVKHSTEEKARDLIGEIYNGGSSEDKAAEIINTWKVGVDDIVGPLGREKKPLLKDEGGEYVYTYIDDPTKLGNTVDNRVFIPIDDDFDGKNFYEADGSYKSNSALFELGKKTNFTSNNFGTNQNFDNFGEELDGSKYFKILTNDVYNNLSMNPGFGTEYLEQYRKNTKKNSVLLQSTFEASYKNQSVVSLDPISGQNKVQEIFNIKYDGPSEYNSNVSYKNQGDTASVLCSYWSQKAPKTKNPDNFTPLYLGNYLATTKEPKYLKGYIMYKPENVASLRQQDRRVPGLTYGLDRPYNDINSYGQQRKLLGDLLLSTKKNNTDDGVVYLPYIEFGISNEEDYCEHFYSLFGSEWYYSQNTPIAKAFLFLHSFSWEGLIGDVGRGDNGSGAFATLFDLYHKDGTLHESSFDKATTIKAIFKNNASFLRAPKLWCAFIGGLLYRERQENDMINFGDPDSGVFVLPFQDGDSYYPKKDQYLYDTRSQATSGINFMFRKGSDLQLEDKQQYQTIDKTLLNLPIGIKGEFEDIFLNFVGDEFKTIQEELELVDTVDNFNNTWVSINANIKTITDTNFGDDIERNSDVKIIPTSILNNAFGVDKVKVVSNYRNISPTEKTGLWGNTNQFNLSLKPNSDINTILVDLIKSNYVILNGVPETFRDSNSTTINDNKYSKVGVSKAAYDDFLKSFFSRFAQLKDDWESNSTSKADELEQELFNSIDDDFIKLNIYRTLGSINTKWLSKTDSVFNRCGNTESNKLIDTFKFLDRSFDDIGDDFYINPFALVPLLRQNFNQSFFDFANRVLSDNNFNFIALPTYLNFTKKEDLISMFTPQSYNDLDESDFNTGPAFICTYVGQVSTNLDVGTDANYPDDGIVLEMGEDCQPHTDDVPGDFNNVPMIGVSYGKQNQGIFKDIALDQKEFAETSESLQIIEDISLGGDKSKATYVGQNLFNVYQTRSYSAEVEMMGCAMMQPMIYFHLNNIPMFRGAYMILKVSHKISANNMSTKFKGVRVKRTKTPLIESSTLFANLLGSATVVERKERINRRTKSTDNTTDNTTTTGGKVAYDPPASDENNNLGIIVE